jgi:hypothetical protein
MLPFITVPARMSLPYTVNFSEMRNSVGRSALLRRSETGGNRFRKDVSILKFSPVTLDTGNIGIIA